MDLGAVGGRVKSAGLDVVLAEKVTKMHDLVARSPEFLGQRRKIQVRGCPFILAEALLGGQLPFPVTQHRRILVILGIGGGFPVGAGLLDLPVQLGHVWSGTHPMLDNGQP